MPTLEQAFHRLFPRHPRTKSPFDFPPLLPADLFAYCGYLLDVSGAYHHISPVTAIPTPTADKALLVSDAYATNVRDIGRSWLDNRDGKRWLPLPPPAVVEMWAELGRHADQPLVAPDQASAIPSWWTIALGLFAIADEASINIGFAGGNPFYAPVLSSYQQQGLSASSLSRLPVSPTSISTANVNIVCVLPKSRTPSVGCTLRSLSHNLALLPPRGVVRTRWIASPFDQTPVGRESIEPTTRSGFDIGLMLIPFPFAVEDAAFCPHISPLQPELGWFSMNPTWFPARSDSAKRRQLLKYILGLIEAAEAAGEEVNGIVLPELAIDHAFLSYLGRELGKNPKIDFIIAGLHDNKEGEPRNTVAIVPLFLKGDQGARISKGWEELLLTREKHHRWKIDTPQAETYQLKGLRPPAAASAAGSASFDWWEKIDIRSRRLDMLVYRGLTTITTLICEDLARVDPCQQVLRAIGPNLVVALLMDGPQLRDRWSGRYAASLADDPGSSVLSFTSYALIARQNQFSEFPDSQAVALWKDEASGTKVIDLPRNADAIVLRLKGVIKQESTLDGRPDGYNSHRWQLVGQNTIAAPRGTCPAWVVSGNAR